MRRLALLALPTALLASLLATVAPASAVELSGAVRSATGTLPPALEVLAERPDHLPAIVAKVEGGRYRIDVPAGIVRLRVAAPGWDDAPRYVFEPALTRTVDFLVYPAALPEPVLAAELTGMGEQDQAIRRAIPPGKPDQAFFERMRREDLAREGRLGAIIDAGGWPLSSRVGYEAAHSAWLIAQHGSNAFLKRCLPLMQAAYDKLEMAPHDLALSIDRDLVNDGKPQRYGSQAQTNADGKTFMLPIEDPSQLDQRRAAMGLEPFAQYTAELLAK